MAIDATMCGERFGAGLHARRVVDGSWRLVSRMAVDRRRPHPGQRPGDNAGVFGGASDTVKASEKEYRCGDTGYDRQSANHPKDTHASLQSSTRQSEAENTSGMK
jgi:hypothetical protein